MSNLGGNHGASRPDDERVLPDSDASTPVSGVPDIASPERLIRDAKKRDDLIIYARKKSLVLANFMAIGMFTEDALFQVMHWKYHPPEWALAIVLGTYLGKGVSWLEALRGWIRKRR